jgi:SPASM domain peptide maturase of grasp-with-spasm system
MSSQMTYFKLFSDCIPVKGVGRSLIVDLRRSSFKLIPNALFEMLTDYADLPIEKLKEIYGEESSDYVDEYIGFLIKNELAFFCDEDEIGLFPGIELDFSEPSFITNAIIDVCENSFHDYKKIFLELHQLKCRQVQFRIYNKMNFIELKRILRFTLNKDLKGIHIILAYNPNIKLELLELLYYSFSVHRIDIHSTPLDLKKDLQKGVNPSVPIFYFTDKITDESHCGVVAPEYFEMNVRSFSESLNFNSCLHKKIAIDKNGEIKNCPSMNFSFGKAATHSLIEISEKPEFRKVWGVTKDQIDICKDCEFRHICIDCRAYTKSNSALGKPEKCNYDPYTMEWKN